jgi:membrane-associated PAP2 superfamily phosphatase
MLSNKPWLHIAASALLLIASLLLFHFSDLDMWVQQKFFDPASQQWLWDRDEPISKFLFYDGIKGALIIYALGLMITLAVPKLRHRVQQYNRPLVVALLSIIIVPAVVAELKTLTNVPCPRSIQAFNGDLPHVSVFDSWPEGTRPKDIQRCFPASHASGGFALMALVLLGHTRRQRLAIVSGTLAIGWIMGGYKMLVGDHFLSHTVVSMLLAWLIISLLTLAVYAKRQV